MTVALFSFAVCTVLTTAIVGWWNGWARVRRNLVIGTVFGAMTWVVCIAGLLALMRHAMEGGGPLPLWARYLLVLAS
jgi:hypothetical protein